MKPLGPNEGINALEKAWVEAGSPECNMCGCPCDPEDRGYEPHRRLFTERDRQALAERVRAGLYVDQDDGWSLSGSLGQAIADETGSYSLEFGTYEQVAEGIAKWIEGVEL